MDDKDRHLLDLLQQDARQPLDRLADAVSLSVPAVQRRIKKLRDTRVIKREVAEVDAEALNVPMTFIIFVELERDQGDQIDAFRRKAMADDLVQQCYYVTGEGDFVLISVARDMNDFEAMTRRLFLNDPNIRGFRTSIAMGKSFRSLAVPARYLIGENCD